MTKSNLAIQSDKKFDEHFSQLLQVFFYLTDECNLRCRQCYYKPWLKNYHAEIDTDTLIALLEKFHDLGAIKLSLLGGEPTLYGSKEGNERLPYIVRQAKEIGYKYVRVVTNGLFKDDFLQSDDLRLLDEITFSIDGDKQEIHDRLRGKGNFNKSIINVKHAIDLGYKVHITTCVHRGNVGKDDKGKLLLERAIEWAADMGVSLINFHPLFKMGIPRDAWTETTDITPQEWTLLYSELAQKISDGKYNIPVRLPQRFVGFKDFEDQSKYYGFCPVKMADRIEVHPNGQIHSCALNNGTPISLAKFSKNDQKISIEWSQSQNEITEYPFDYSKDHSCAVMKKDFKDLVPLCISFKPKQEEFIWKSTGLS